MSVCSTGPISSAQPEAGFCGRTSRVCTARSKGYWPWVSSTSFCQFSVSSREGNFDESIQLASSSVYQRPLTFQPRPTSGQTMVVSLLSARTVQ